MQNCQSWLAHSHPVSVPGRRGQGLSRLADWDAWQNPGLGGGPAHSPCGGGLIKGLMVQWAGHQTGHLEAWGRVQLAAALLGDLKQITWPLTAPSAPCLLPVWQGSLEEILMGQLAGTCLFTAPWGRVQALQPWKTLTSMDGSLGLLSGTTPKCGGPGRGVGSTCSSSEQGACLGSIRAVPRWGN